MSSTRAKIGTAVKNHSKIDMGCYNHTTTDFGRMDVVYWTHVTPGDSIIDLSASSFLRAAPMAAPTFGKVDLDVRFFFVPLRILCDETSFNIKNYLSGLTPNVTHPYIKETDLCALPISSSSINVHDFKRVLSQFGLPPRAFNGDAKARQSYSPFPFMAYDRIWWDYYRNSRIVSDVDERLFLKKAVVGNNTSYSFKPHYASWKKDYFTNATLEPNEGGLVLVGSAGEHVSTADVPSQVLHKPSNVSNFTDEDTTRSVIEPSNTNEYEWQFANNAPWHRAAEALQRYAERNNLPGTRYLERLLARFGTAPEPKTLNMAEYLGGSRSSMQVGDITSNNGFNTSDDPMNAFGYKDYMDGMMVGTMSGKGIIEGKPSKINYHVNEPGIIMGISTIVPETGYYQGIDKQLTLGLNSPNDYFVPELENIGYEPIYVKELRTTTSSDTSDLGKLENTVFGWTPRYSAAYKHHKQMVNGDLVLSGTSAGMDSLHLFRTFPDTGYVFLNELFTTITPKSRHMLDRIFSVQGSEVALYDHFTGIHKINCVIDRPMSSSPLPTLEINNDNSVENGGIRF